MSSPPTQSLDWEPVVAGDTMSPVHLLFKDAGAPLVLTTAAMHVRDARGRLVLDWPDGGPTSALVLINAVDGHVQVGPATIDLTPDTYYYDLEASSARYGARTWFRGVFPVEARR